MSDAKVLQWPWQKSLALAIAQDGPTAAAAEVAKVFDLCIIGQGNTQAGREQCQRVAHALSLLASLRPPVTLDEAKDDGSTNEPLKGV